MDRRTWIRSSAAALAGGFAMPFLHPQRSQAATLDPAGPIRMNFNENPYGPSPKVFEAYMAHTPEYSQYPGPAFADLQRMAAEVMGARPEQCVVTNGSMEALKTASLLAYRTGRGVVSPRPTYDNLVQFAGHLGAPVRWIPLTADMDTDLEAMSAAIGADTGMVFVCNPANPTGIPIAHDRLLSFVDSVPRDVFIVVDEAYAELATGPAFRTLIPWLDAYPNLIITRTMSKAYGMVGYRIGYALANEELAARINALRTTYVTAVGVRAAMAALDDTDWRDFCVRSTDVERKRMAAFFRERGVRTFDSEANCLWQHTGMDIDDYRRMFEAEGILLSRPFEPMRDWCRVSLADDAGNTRFMEVWDRLFG